MLITGVSISSTMSPSFGHRRVTGLAEAEFPHLKNGSGSDFKGGGTPGRREHCWGARPRAGRAPAGPRPGAGHPVVLGPSLPRSARRDEPEGAAPLVWAHKNTSCSCQRSPLAFIAPANPGASPCGNLLITDNPGKSCFKFL